MSYVPEDYEGQGEYSVQTRSESFTLRGEWSDERAERAAGLRHGIWVYPDVEGGQQGSIEVLLEDVDKLRVCLDVVQWVKATSERGEPFEDVPACYEVVDPSDGEHLLARVRTREQAQRI